MRGFVVPPGIEWRGKARHRECNLATRKTKGFKENKKTFQKGRSNFQVVPPGIEPGTHGFSVRCSTN